MSSVNVRYIVSDVDAAVRFYTEQLDFEVEMRPAPGFAALRRNELKLLINAPGAGGAGQAVNGERPAPGGWNRIQIPVDDLNSYYARLRAQGATFRNEIVQGQGGKQVLLQDPSGNPIEPFEARRQGKVQVIPDGAQTVMPFLSITDVRRFLDFIERAFGGRREYALESADGIIRHARIRVGNSLIMVSSGTQMFAPMPCMLHVYVEDVDAVYRNALAAGAVSLREPVNQFYGDRSAGIEDAWKNQWWLATHVEDVDADEMMKREAQFREQQ